MSIDRMRELASSSTLDIDAVRYVGVLAPTVRDRGAIAGGHVIRPARFEGYLLVTDLDTGEVIGQLVVATRTNEPSALDAAVEAAAADALSTHCPGMSVVAE